MKELLKFSKELKAFRNQGAYPQGDVKNALADIYEANWQKKWGVKKINRGCGSCIGDMMKCLCAEFESMQKEYKFSDNPSNSEVFLKTEILEKPLHEGVLKKLSKDEIDDILPDPYKEDFTDYTVGQLQEECIKRGIKFHHRAGVKKLTELLNG